MRGRGGGRRRQSTLCTQYAMRPPLPPPLLAPGAMDDTLLEHLLKEGVPTFAMSSGLTLEDFGWGTPVRTAAATRPMIELPVC